MSSSTKISPSSSPTTRGQLFRVAVVGGASLKGKELADMLSERNFPAIDVRLLDDDESIGQLEATGDEINFIQSVRSEQFSNVDFTFFASDPDSTRANWKRARDAGSAVIDLSAALEDEPGAQIRSVWMERERGELWQPELQPGPCIVAHPAAVILALLLTRAAKTGSIRGAVATVFEPASEQGQKGMDELHQQSVNLLSFQALPKDVFDEQVAFNMVARYGANSRLSLAALETRIRRHYQEIAASDTPHPAIMAVQAPVFHGYAVSIFLETDQPANVDQLAQAISGDHVTLASAESQPTNVSTAGQANISVSVRNDSNRPNGMWLWAAADNLRLAAIAAVDCAETMIPTRPLGKIQ